jgi:hypothetical protein
MKPKTFEKTSLAAAFLLLLFACGLGLAMLLVKVRSAIHLSAPIPLPGEGLSVVLPFGSGWKTLTEWSYEQDNSFALIAIFSPERAPLAEVRWQYRLAEKPLSAEELLKQHAVRFSGTVSSIEKFEGQISFYWLFLFPHADEEQMLLAAAVPRQGRALLLQIKGYSDPLYLFELFERLAARAVFHPDPRREVSGQLFGDIAEHLYPQWLQKLQGQPDIFLLHSTAGTPLGYSRTAISNSAAILDTAIEQEQIYRQIELPRIKSRFEASAALTEFVWTTIRQVRRRPTQTLLKRLPDGSVQVEDSYQRKDVFWPVKDTLPEILIPLLARAMLDCPQSEAVMDIIAPAGQVVPTLISKKTAEQAAESIDRTQYVVKVDFLHHPDNYEEYYFDDQRVLLGRLEMLPGQSRRLWKAADKVDLNRFLNPPFSKPDQIVQSPATPMFPAPGQKTESDSKG